jgi:hypothetical protein
MEGQPWSTLAAWLKMAADWSELAAWAALVLSLGTLIGGVIRPWLRGRKASPAAQLDLFSYISVATKDLKDEEPVVITNHGPAHMRDVTVELFIESGEPMARAVPGVTALWPKMPFERQHADQSLYFDPRSGPCIPERPRGRNHVARRQNGEQSCRIGLSYNRMI